MVSYLLQQCVYYEYWVTSSSFSRHIHTLRQNYKWHSFQRSHCFRQAFKPVRTWVTMFLCNACMCVCTYRAVLMYVCVCVLLGRVKPVSSGVTFAVLVRSIHYTLSNILCVAWGMYSSQSQDKEVGEKIFAVLCKVIFVTDCVCISWPVMSCYSWFLPPTSSWRGGGDSYKVGGHYLSFSYLNLEFPNNRR